MVREAAKIGGSKKIVKICFRLFMTKKRRKEKNSMAIKPEGGG